MTDIDTILSDAIQTVIVNNILNIYHDTIRNIRNPNRISLLTNNIISSRYYNNPPIGGYSLNEEHDYTFPDHDDISASIFLEVVTRFGSPGSELVKESQKNKIKNIGKYKKVKESNQELADSNCPICLDNFIPGEYYRNLECNHCFHKKCIDRWFKKDHTDCPMCRKKIIN